MVTVLRTSGSVEPKAGGHVQGVYTVHVGVACTLVQYAQSPSGGDTLPSRGDTLVPTRVRAVVICGLGRKWRALSTRE